MQRDFFIVTSSGACGSILASHTSTWQKVKDIKPYALHLLVDTHSFVEVCDARMLNRNTNAGYLIIFIVNTLQNIVVANKAVFCYAAFCHGAFNSTIGLVNMHAIIKLALL